MKRLLHLFSALALAAGASAQNGVWETLCTEGTKLTSYSEDLPVTLSFGNTTADTLNVVGVHWGPENYKMTGKCWKEGNNVRLKLSGTDNSQNRTFVSGILYSSNYSSLQLRNGEIAIAEKGSRPVKQLLVTNFSISNKAVDALKKAEAQNMQDLEIAEKQLKRDMEKYKAEKNDTWAMLTIGDTKLNSEAKDIPLSLTFLPQPSGYCLVTGQRLGENPYKVEGKCWKDGNTVRIELTNTDTSHAKTTIVGKLRRTGWGSAKLHNATITTVGRGMEPMKKKVNETFKAESQRLAALHKEKMKEQAAKESYKHTLTYPDLSDLRQECQRRAAAEARHSREMSANRQQTQN